MSVLLQISDTHFGTEQPPVVEALAAFTAQQRPDVVVLSGDITQRARRAQFHAARAFVERLATPVLAIPMGGHIHLPYVMPLPGLPRRLWSVQAGTAVSHRVRDGQLNSVNVLRWGRDAPPGRCVVEQWDCPATGPAFVRAAVTEFEPQRVG